MNTEMKSKMSIRAVVAGTTVTFATALLLMSAASALGIWSNSFSEFSQGNSDKLWVWTSIAWIASAFMGGYIASKIGMPKQTEESILYGVVTWSASFVLGSLFLTMALGYFGNLSSYQWLGFLSNSLALIACMVGSTSGHSKYEVSFRKTKPASYGVA